MATNENRIALAGSLDSVAGPVLKLFKQANTLLGGKCEVFYAGSVAPPK